MIDAFKDLWDAMDEKQRDGIAWMAVKDDRVLGRGEDNDLIKIGCAAFNEVARFRSTNYQEYQDQVVALAKGLASGLLDGGIEYYLRK